MKKRSAWAVLPVTLGMLLLAGCSLDSEGSQDLISPDETYETTGNSSGDYEIRDKASLYEDQSSEVVTMYLTVGMGNEADGTNHTWTEMNSYSLDYYEENGLEPYKCEAVLQVGDEQGPVGSVK